VEAFVDDTGTAEGWPTLQNAAAVDFGDFNLLIGLNPERDWHNNEGMNALHLACRYGHVKAAGFLINAGARLDARQAEGCTPFHVACMYGQLEFLKLLCKKGPKIQMSDENSHSNPAIHLAVINNQLDVVRWLLEKGADISSYGGGDKKTPLHYACQYQSCRESCMFQPANKTRRRGKYFSIKRSYEN
jgi:ankyrin repeat protein